MDSPLEIVVDIVIAILLILIFPLIYIGQKQDALTQSIVEIKTDELIQEVRSKGYIDREMYENYIEEITSTGVLYDVSMEHTHQVLEPEYRFRTPEEVMEEQDRKFTGENVYTYRPVYSEIPYVEDPIDNSGLTMNEETNESILEDAVRTPADPNHVHTADCYAGHVHSGSKSFTYSHSHTGACRNYLSRADAIVTCRSCNKNYVWTNAAYYWNTDTNSQQVIYIDTSGSKNCIYCRSSNLQVTMKNNYSYSCYYNIDEDKDGYHDTVPNGVVKLYPGQSAPQSQEQATYTDGCYQYHKTKYLSDSFEYYQYGGLNKSSAWRAFNTMVYTNRFQGYCTVPEFYYIGLYSSNESLDINELPTYAYVAYQAYISDDGSLHFRYSGYWVDSSFRHTSIGPGFPQTMSIDEFISNVSAVNSFFKKSIGLDLNARLEPDPSSTITWYNTRYKDGSYYTPYINTCEYDHSLGVNGWVPICGQVEDKTIICSEKIVSLQPTHPIQAIYVGEPLITTANATYQDGSTNIVLCNTSFTSDVPTINETVTLTYTDARGNVLTCTITVTVIPKMKTCENGHDYNLNVDGSDPGCPYCKAWLKELEIYIPQPPSITIYRGTTLQENGVTLLATYLDGHKEYVATDYLDNLDKYYVGIQDVTIGYKGKYVNLTVTTKRNMVLCPICNRYYELYPDDSDPGCPYCAAKTPIFTGNILEYENKYYETDILKKLYESDGIYYFTYRDYFNINVRNRSKGWGRGILKFISKGIGDEYIHVVDGGYIREEIKKYK